MIMIRKYGKYLYSSPIGTPARYLKWQAQWGFMSDDGNASTVRRMPSTEGPILRIGGRILAECKRDGGTCRVPFCHVTDALAI